MCYVGLYTMNLVCLVATDTFSQYFIIPLPSIEYRMLHNCLRWKSGNVKPFQLKRLSWSNQSSHLKRSNHECVSANCNLVLQTWSISTSNNLHVDIVGAYGAHTTMCIHTHTHTHKSDNENTSRNTSIHNYEYYRNSWLVWTCQFI